MARYRAPNFFPHFFLLSRVRAAGSRLVLLHVWCPLNLRVAFNKIMRFKAAKWPAEAPPMDIELTHYRQCVPRKRRKKRGKKFGALYLAPKTGAVFQIPPPKLPSVDSACVYFIYSFERPKFWPVFKPSFTFCQARHLPTKTS